MCFWNRISSNGLKIPSFSYQLPGLVKFIRAYERKLVVAWVVFWVLVSISTFWYFSSQAMEKRTETLASMCDVRARMLQDQFNVSFNRFQAISILISTFHHGKIPSAIDQRTFSECIDRTSFERPLPSGVAYATRVLHSEREEFERQQGWTIRRMDSLEQNPVHKDEYGPEALEPSPVQEEYAPVIFAQDPISHVVSIDMLSGKEDRENLLRARSSGKGGLTAPFPLIKTNRLGVILTFAVYKSDLPSNATPKERIEATNGYLGGVFDIESLVENVLLQLASKQTILVNVYDTTNHSQPISMFGSNVSADGWEHVSRLNFGDPFRKHEMRCRFMQKPPWPVLSMVTSVGILVIALLVAHIIHATVSWMTKVEENCHKMEQLKKKAEAADVAKSQEAARDRYTEFSTGNYRAKPGSSSSDAKTNTDLPDRTFTNSQMDGIAFEIKQSLDELNKIRSQLGKIICCLLLLFIVAAYMSTRLIGERGAIDTIAVNVPKMPKDIPAEGTENPRDRYTEFSTGNYGAKPESSSSDAKMNTDLLDRTFTNSRMHDKVKPPKIQVFINFRGVQLRNNFVGYLVDALRRSEINVFIDNHEQKGEDLNTLFKRIEDSGIAIVVFSSRYTESKWCLEELVKIKERVHQGLLKVLPIFYKVTPTNVKRLKGDFGDHFRDKEYMYQSDEPMIKRWKEAIMFVSHKFALTFDENSSVMEIDFVETIVVEVLEMLQAIFKVESGQSSCNLVCADKAKLKRG